MKFAIADPPYLGRAVRWYGEGGCGNGYGNGQADNHPNAAEWDDPQKHIELVDFLNKNYDGWAIAMTVHSLSTYLSVIETDSRNGIRVGVWHKPSAFPSGNRVSNNWEPVIFKIPKERRGRKNGVPISDVITANPNRKNFVGSKPENWTLWVIDVLGINETDQVDDLFSGSGSVQDVLDSRFI